MAIVGVVLALVVTGTSVSVMVLIGLVVLAGHRGQQRASCWSTAPTSCAREGRSKLDALVEAGSMRLRPILMTTLTTVLGLLPMALGLGEGAEVRAPLAHHADRRADRLDRSLTLVVHPRRLRDARSRGAGA